MQTLPSKYKKETGTSNLRTHMWESNGRHSNRAEQSVVPKGKVTREREDREKQRKERRQQLSQQQEGSEEKDEPVDVLLMPSPTASLLSPPSQPSSSSSPSIFTFLSSSSSSASSSSTVTTGSGNKRVYGQQPFRPYTANHKQLIEEAEVMDEKDEPAALVVEEQRAEEQVIGPVVSRKRKARQERSDAAPDEREERMRMSKQRRSAQSTPKSLEEVISEWIEEHGDAWSPQLRTVLEGSLLTHGVPITIAVAEGMLKQRLSEVHGHSGVG